MKTTLLILLPLVLLFGCKSWRSQGSIELDGVKLDNPADAESPAQVNTTDTKTTGTIEPGTKAEVPVQVAGRPTVLSIVFPKIEFAASATSTQATVSQPRPPDKSVELKREANKARAPLLYAAIAMALLGGIARALASAWPSLSTGLWLAAALAGAAWKFAEVPWWAFLLALAAALLLIAGYKRGEIDANKNGIPDILEKKPPASNLQSE